MIKVYPSENFAGVVVSGDYFDLDQLYESLHYILPSEGEDIAYEQVGIRVLGFCYDLRHAKMGNRDIVYVENGLHEEAIKQLKIHASTNNIYFAFPTLYPEMIFILMALNHFVRKYDQFSGWLNPSVLVVKSFQAAVLSSLEEILSPQKYLNTLRSINRGSHHLADYVTQYVDLLNLRFIEMDKDTREKQISIMAKRLSERGKEYQQVQNEVYAAARKNNCHPEQIRLKGEYPEYIDW